MSQGWLLIIGSTVLLHKLYSSNHAHDGNLSIETVFTHTNVLRDDTSGKLLILRTVVYYVNNKPTIQDFFLF